MRLFYIILVAVAIQTYLYIHSKPFLENLERRISSVIRGKKRDKEDDGAISARPVKRPSVQQREHHAIGSTSLAQVIDTCRIVNPFIFTTDEIIF
jgi:hypothetical protein